MTPPRRQRCAIYTRKSSEEGLDQDFTSLDAQREACSAYIQSQRHEGWLLVPTLYDDGGYSGGTLERPAMKQLLADIDAGKIDLIVVYKIDRLTRALSDFAKIVERLDARSASFVSVTQSFNTTTSMGRLTLNVLLSFAQFEREVTGERIRDKIAASKKKGMWMGGFVPIGYDAVDRQLKINADEATIVRRIFELYRQSQNIASVSRTLAADGVRSKQRPHAKGRGQGGATYSSGALHSILRNPLYCGRIQHKGVTYPGQHDAIVSLEVWEDVQRIQTAKQTNAVHRGQGKNPLLRIVVDEQHRRYQAVHTTKGGRRYRYYVSRAEREGAGTSDPQRVRLPAKELEEQVAARIRAFLRSTAPFFDAVREDGESARAQRTMVAHARALADCASLVDYAAMLQRVCVRPSSIDVVLDRKVLRELLGAASRGGVENPDGCEVSADIVLTIASRIYKTGHELRLVVDNGPNTAVSGKRDIKLIRLVARGRLWYEELTSGRVPSLRAIATREGLTDTYVSRVFNAALLAPDIIEHILRGTQPVTLTVESLRTPPPLDWPTQRIRFGLQIS